MKCSSACKQDRYTGGRHDEIGARASRRKKGLFRWTSGLATKARFWYKSYCSAVHFRRITSIYQPTNAHIISHKTLLRHFKTL